MDNNNIIYTIKNHEIQIIDNSFDKTMQGHKIFINYETMAYLALLMYSLLPDGVKLNASFISDLFPREYKKIISIEKDKDNRIVILASKDYDTYSWRQQKPYDIHNLFKPRVTKRDLDRFYIITIVNIAPQASEAVEELVSVSTHYRPALYDLVTPVPIGESTYLRNLMMKDEDEIEAESYNFLECRIHLSNKNNSLIEVAKSNSHSYSRFPHGYITYTKIYASLSLDDKRRKIYEAKFTIDFLGFCINEDFFLAVSNYNEESLVGELSIFNLATLKKWALVNSTALPIKHKWLKHVENKDTSEIWTLLTLSPSQGLCLWKIYHHQDHTLSSQLAHVFHGHCNLDMRNVILKRSSGVSKQDYQLIKQRSERTHVGHRLKKIPSSAVLQVRNAQAYIPEGEMLYVGKEGTIRITQRTWLIQWVRYRHDDEARQAPAEPRLEPKHHTWLIIQGLDEKNYTVTKEAHFYLNAHKPHFFTLVGKGFHVIKEKAPRDLEYVYGDKQLASLPLEVSSKKVMDWLNTLMQSNERTYTLEGRMGYNCVSWCREQIAILGLPLQTEEYPHLINRIAAVPKHYIPDTPVEEPDDAPKCCIM